MPDTPPRILRAWLDSLSSGVVEFERNRGSESPPQLTLGAGAPPITSVLPAPGLAAGRTYGYFAPRADELSFVLPLQHGCSVDPERDQVYLAGEFNGWQQAVGRAEWRLSPAELEGERVLLWTGRTEKILVSPFPGFKFVTGENLWLGLPDDAPNAVDDGRGNFNRAVLRNRTGAHLWRFTVEQPLDLSRTWSVAEAGEPVDIGLGYFFHELKTDLPLGPLVSADTTVFRLFAPRAAKVTLFLCEELAKPAEQLTYALARRLDADGAAGVWEVALDRNLHGWFYWYTLDGTREGQGKFDPAVRVLDPYARACLDRTGPGIVLSGEWLGRADRSFHTPAWNDLVIAEVHVRDLTANAPVTATPEERRGFAGLRRWVESPDFYLHGLGVNCVELQPVQEFDNQTTEEYHWGYMTNNFFAPESSYALAPARASGVKELQELVAAFHARGMAVLLDVVYNHVGVPAHLLYIDRLYYFELDREGQLANWSGCGNDVRAAAAMAQRLIIDSCVHLIETYGVDGFRFDLAELLGVEVLREIEAALKKVKPDVVLIAEPWSFRGHIAGALRDTGWASWNDGYRDFVRDYVRGNGGADRLEYFLRGSPWYFAKWPAQTVNYTESHDDRTWLDAITENPGHDGSQPTANDRRRTHLMAAILFMSIGIPMVAEGQDFLRSKGGMNNSYQRGDLNALDYHRLYRHLGTHTYFADWIDFRRGHLGRMLRHHTRSSEGFFRFIPAAHPAAVAVLYNADGSQGHERLLFALNPTPNDLTIPVGAEVVSLGAWRQAADQERFYPRGGHGTHIRVEADLYLPALGCGLWICGE